MTDTGHSADADIRRVDEGVLQDFLDRVGVGIDTLDESAKDRVADLLGDLLAAEQRDGPRSAGQKTTTMTDDDPTIDDLAAQHGAALRKEALAAELSDATDDLGRKKGRPHDPANRRSDDLGNRRDDGGLGPEEAAEAAAGVIGQKLAAAADDDVDARIAEVADGEEW